MENPKHLRAARETFCRDLCPSFSRQSLLTILHILKLQVTEDLWQQNISRIVGTNPSHKSRVDSFSVRHNKHEHALTSKTPLFWVCASDHRGPSTSRHISLLVRLKFNGPYIPVLRPFTLHIWNSALMLVVGSTWAAYCEEGAEPVSFEWPE